MGFFPIPCRPPLARAWLTVSRGELALAVPSTLCFRVVLPCIRGPPSLVMLLRPGREGRRWNPTSVQSVQQERGGAGRAARPLFAPLLLCFLPLASHHRAPRRPLRGRWVRIFPFAAWGRCQGPSSGSAHMATSVRASVGSSWPRPATRARGPTEQGRGQRPPQKQKHMFLLPFLNSTAPACADTPQCTRLGTGTGLPPSSARPSRDTVSWRL